MTRMNRITRMTRRWPRPEFLVARRRIPALAWAWAATGVLALVATVGEGLAWQGRSDAEAARLTTATQRIAGAAPAASRPDAPAVAKADVEAVRAAKQVLARLDHPWGPIISSVEAETPAGLQWLTFDHAADNPALSFEGLAPDIATVLQLVDMLSARAGWSDVVLARWQAPETRDTPGAVPLWRFEIRAAVDARRIAAGRTHGGP